MRLEVKITHHANVCVKPKLKSETMTFDATVHVNVPEAADDEAPVALRYEDWSDGMVALRWFDGRLWAPRTFDEGRGTPKVHQRADDLRNACGETDSYLGIADGNRTRGTPNGELAALPNVRRIDSSDLEERVEKVRGMASDVLVVEGAVWRAVEEPVLSVSWHGMSERERGAYVSIVKHPSSRTASNLFRLDEVDAVLASVGKADRSVLPSFEVILREAITARLPERALCEWSERLAASMGDHVKEGDRAYFDAFLALRDALPMAKAALASDPDEGHGDLEALADAAEVAARADHARVVRQDQYERGKAVDLTHLERYRDFAQAHDPETDAILSM